MSQQIIETALLEIDHLRAKIDALKTELDHNKRVDKLHDFIDLHYPSRPDFAKKIGTTRQNLNSMHKLGYIIIDNKPYLPAVTLAEKMKKLDIGDM